MPSLNNLIDLYDKAESRTKHRAIINNWEKMQKINKELARLNRSIKQKRIIKGA